MSQFKAAMERIHGPATTTSGGHADEQSEKNDEPTTNPPDSVLSAEVDLPAARAHSPSQHLLISNLERHAAFLLMPVCPLLWCILLICTLDRDALLSAYAMPLLGIFSAALANAVPGELLSTRFEL